MLRSQSLDFSLPPRLEGNTHGTLEVRIDGVYFFSSTPAPCRTRVLMRWWGQSPDARVLFSPDVLDDLQHPTVAQTGQGLKLVVFKVVTGPARFRQYLHDAARLPFEVYQDQEGHEAALIGYAVLDNLVRILVSKTLTDDLDVFNDNGELLGKLRCQIQYKSIIQAAKDTPRKPKVCFKPVSACSGSSDKPGATCQFARLAPHRLASLSTATNLTVNVRKLLLKPELVQRILHHGKTLPGIGPKVSFFLSFSVPPGEEEKRLCSIRREDQCRRRQAAQTQSVQAEAEEIVFFDSTSHHPVHLDEPQILDTWWTRCIHFKIHSRLLNQKTPSYLGQAAFALKHLLLQQSYCNGQVIQIPVYACSSVTKWLLSEILGDLVVDFSLKSAPSPEDEKPGKVLLKSRTRSRMDCDAVPVREPSLPAVPPHTPVDQVVLKTHLRIAQGRQFDSSLYSNLFVSCRFPGSGTVLRSAICWDMENPCFNLTYSSVLVLSDTFLCQFCKDNYLFVEVWSSNKSNQELVGLAAVPLHQIYASFYQVSDEARSLILAMESPVVTWNDWIAVEDMVSGKHIGQLIGTFAIGLERQIANLLRLMHEPPVAQCGHSESLLSQDRPDEPSLGDKAVSQSFEDLSSEEAVREAKVDEKQLDEVEGPDRTEDDVAVLPSITSAKQQSTGSAIEELMTSHTVHVQLKVTVDEACHLPRILCKKDLKRIEPDSYVTLPSSASQSASFPTSQVIRQSTCPNWHFVHQLELPHFMLMDSKQHFIVKIWHRQSMSASPNYEKDPIIGFAAIDLTPLLLQNGFEYICGWYNIMDFVGRCRGQIKVKVEPMDLDGLRRLYRDLGLMRNSQEAPIIEDTSISNHHHSLDRRELMPERSLEDKGQVDYAPRAAFWVPPQPRPELDLMADNLSLESTLQELNKLSEDLRNRLARISGVDQDTEKLDLSTLSPSVSDDCSMSTHC